MRHRKGSSRLLTTVALCLALLGLTPVAASAAGAPAGCPAVMRTEDVRKGMTGTGLTVVSGDTPQSFGAEVLGVLENALAPGKDLIVVEASGAAVEKHGIWAGMSGSPVTVNGKLLGAIAYGFTASPNTIAGVTPAEDMMDVLTLGGADTASFAEHVEPDDEMREEIADRHDMRPQAVGSFARLKTPLAVSGVTQRGIDRLSQALTRTESDFIPFAGGSVSAQAGEKATTTPRPGGNLAAVASYGDVTLAAVGTTTYVCDGRAVGFGHPFSFAGPVSFGANDADALRVVTDSTFGSYKLARVDDAGFGSIDQDRLSGVRLDLGTMPDLIPITSSVEDLDTGKERDGRTDLTDSSFAPFVGLLHLLGNIDSTIDRIGPGSSSLSWSVQGTRADGSEWSLERDNRYATPGDVAFETIFELLAQLSLIQDNPHEAVQFTEIELDAEVEEAVRRYTLESLMVSVDGAEPMPVSDTEPLFVAPGTTLNLVATLRPYRSSRTIEVSLPLEIPADAVMGGTLTVSGGGVTGDPFLCAIDPQACGLEAAEPTLDGLLEALENAPRNDELVARLMLDAGFPAPTEPEQPKQDTVVADPGRPGSGKPVAEAKAELDQVVSGMLSVPVIIQGPSVLARLHGGDRIGTASELARTTMLPDGADTAVLVRADAPADAITAAPLAQSTGAALLLTAGDALSPATEQTLRELGVRKVILLGGQTALGSGVEAGLRAAGITDIERIAGRDRFDTARQVAARMPGDLAYVVNGEGASGWADALTGGALAAHQGRPVLLGGTGGLPDATREALRAGGFTEVVIVGGTRAVGTATETELAGMGLNVRRVSGGGRYATALLAADESTMVGADPTRVWLASGLSWADALTAGRAAARDGGVLLLTDPTDLANSPEVREWLGRYVGAPLQVTLVGGPAAISSMVEQQVAEMVYGGMGGGYEPVPPASEEPVRG